METTFQKYPAYKDSGVEWLGEIPKGWEAIRMKYIFRDVSIKNKPEEELLSVTQDKGVVPRSWVENRMVMPSGSLETFKFIRKGDFAISLRSFEGGLEYCYHDGIISPAYTVLKKKKGLIDLYYKYLFKSNSFISEIQTSVVGIREGKNISYPELSYSLLPIPRHEEQTAIANFLDDKTAKIDRVIAQKEKLIALLKERKQIIIQNAVTKGLDPNVKMKDSGVEWIEEIPKHWEVKKVKHCAYKISKGTTPSTEGRSILDSGIVRFIKAENIQDGIITDNPEHFIDEKTNEIIGRSKLKANDILFVIAGATLGKVAIVSEKELPANTNQAVSFIRPNKVTNPNYLMNWLTSSFIRKVIWLEAVQSAQPNLSMEDLGNLPFISSTAREQEQILNHIDNISIKIDQATSLQQTQIEKLKEYKATLIDAAVTGKIKVS